MSSFEAVYERLFAAFRRGGGRQNFLDAEDVVLEVSGVPWVLYLIGRGPSYFLESLFLSSDASYRSLVAADWKEILASVPRGSLGSDPLVVPPCYWDIEFLCGYVRVDAIACLKTVHPDWSVVERAEKAMRRRIPYLDVSQSDLDGISLLDREVFAGLRQELMDSGFSGLPSDWESLRRWGLSLDGS